MSFNRKGSSGVLAERFISVSESEKPPAIVKALIYILISGYVGRYGMDSNFRQFKKNVTTFIIIKGNDFDALLILNQGLKALRTWLNIQFQRKNRE